MRISKICVFLIVFLTPLIGNSQCAMCRAVLESQDSSKTAEGINNGIIYLMIIPYVLFAGLGLYIYKSRKKSS